LYRTQQFRNHVPLHHLRWPLKAGLVVEVCNTSKTKWRPATIKKIMLDATDRVYLVELEGKEVVVSGSSIRRCLPEKSQVRVYRGPSVGWEPGVVQGEVEETLVKSTDTGEQFHHIVSRPLRGCETTDFDVVPDARMFAIALDEKTDIIPVHLLCSEDDVA